MNPSVPRVARTAIAVLLGLVAGFRAWTVSLRGAQPGDLAQVWYAARSMLHGSDPYSAIGPGRAFEWMNGFYYPLPAAVALIPLIPLSQTWACTFFVAIAGGCFAWALMEHGYAPLLGFASAGMVFAIEVVQWSPLLSASLVLAPLAVLYVAKPTIGAALFVARPSRWAIGGGALLILVAFVIQPTWVSSWQHALGETSLTRATKVPYAPPVSMPGGAIALLSLLRWRRSEARLVAAMSCVPQTLYIYEAVPLLLVPRTFRESYSMLALSWAALIMTAVTAHALPVAERIDASGRWMVWLLYLPATLMVLRRPNEGRVPKWLERGIAQWPRWVRGMPRA